MRVRVMWRSSGKPLADHPLAGQRLTIGKTSACDIKITNGALSRTHLVLYRHDDVVLLADTGTTCGTYVARRLTKCALIGPDSPIETGGMRVVVDGCRAIDRSEAIALARRPDVGIAMRLQLVRLAPDELAAELAAFAETCAPRSVELDAIDLIALGADGRGFAMPFAARAVDSRVRVSVARKLPTELIDLLADDPAADVQRRFHAHLVDDVYALGRHAADPRAAVRTGVAENRRTPDEAIVALAGDPDPDVRCALTMRPLPRDVAWRLSADREYRVRLRACWLLGASTPDAETISMATWQEESIDWPSQRGGGVSVSRWSAGRLSGSLSRPAASDALDENVPRATEWRHEGTLEVRAFIGEHHHRIEARWEDRPPITAGAEPRCRGTIEWASPDKLSVVLYALGPFQGEYHASGVFDPTAPLRFPALVGPGGLRATLDADANAPAGRLIETFLRGGLPAPDLAGAVSTSG